ncbi:MAG: malto-oligosyltrehalose trehalohydrolase [Pirellulales bacterium]
MQFKVWAPFAKTVELQISAARVPMERQNNDWWLIEVADAGPGTDYWFRVDGSEPLPDPRSGWQPEGPLGSSRIVDQAAFRWTDEQWQARPLSSAVIYEIHIGTFTREGTFEAAIEKLPHLVDLGITYVEIMPVAEFKGARGWGYDGVDLYAPHHVYGGPAGLKRLVNACHEHGLGVILDVVYNHLGPSGNFLPRFGPYFSARHTTPWGPSLNFDGPYSDEVRRYFCDNALMWLRDYHFDGLRLDAIHAIVDTSAMTFLEQLATEVDELKAHLGRHLVVIAESDLNDPRVVRPWQMGGYDMDAQWSDDIHHSVHSVLTGEREGYYSDFGLIADLAVAMRRPYVYAGRHSTFRQRRHGRPPTGLRGSSFVAFLQNHDQLGNRARGDRICHLVSPDRAKIGAALVLLSPFVPLLFQGEEWSVSSPFQYFVDFADEPDLARAVREGRREEFALFGWNPDDVPDPNAIETFQRSKLNWSEASVDEHAGMLRWYQDLIRLRSKYNGLTDGRLEVVNTYFDEDEQWLVIERGPITIACNFAADRRGMRVECVPLGRLVLASKNGVSVDGNLLSLPADSVAVFAPDEG